MAYVQHSAWQKPYMCIRFTTMLFLKQKMSELFSIHVITDPIREFKKLHHPSVQESILQRAAAVVLEVCLPVELQREAGGVSLVPGLL